MIICLAATGVALAAFSKVTGGTTQVTASAAAAMVLSDNHITVTPLAPATQSGATFTFPIAGGRLDPATLHGVIRHKGGLSLSNGTRTVKLREPTIVSTKSGAWLYAIVRGPAHHVCARIRPHHPRVRCLTVIRSHSERIAHIINATVTGGSATATLTLTTASAHLIDALAGKHVASAGDVLGTGTIAPTLEIARHRCNLEPRRSHRPPGSRSVTAGRSGSVDVQVDAQQ